jgi:hypothetical protein
LIEAIMPDVIPCDPWGEEGCRWDFMVTFTEGKGIAATIEQIGRRYIDVRGGVWISNSGEWFDKTIEVPAGGSATYDSWVRTKHDSDGDLRGGTVVVSYKGIDERGNAFSGSVSASLARMSATPTPTPDADATSTTEAEEASAANADLVVVATTMDIFEGPGTNYASLGTLAQADTVEVLGQSDACAWLQVKTVDGLVGWISGRDEDVEQHLTCDTLPPGTFRPFTGVIIPSLGGGEGELTVENGTDSDSVVILILDEIPVTSVYVRTGDSFTLQDIQDGIYHLYFSKGSGWNGKAFTQDASYQRFEDEFDFETSDTQYSSWEVTLYGVEGGTAATESLDPSQFPDLGQ